MVEDEPGRVMLELGFVGFAGIYFLRVYLILRALRQVFVLRTAFHRAIATSCVLFFLAHLPGGVVFNVTSGVFYWFFAGLLLVAMRLDSVRLPGAAVPAAEAAPSARPPRPARPMQPVPRPEPVGPLWEWPVPPS
jgi:hypothetical protein